MHQRFMMFCAQRLPEQDDGIMITIYLRHEIDLKILHESAYTQDSISVGPMSKFHRS